MNDIINKFLLPGDKFLPEMYLKHSGFNYSACEPFTKNKERIQKFKGTRDTKYTFRNKLEKACFQLERRTTFYKALRGKALSISKNPKYGGYQRGLDSMVYNCFDKRLLVEQLLYHKVNN